MSDVLNDDDMHALAAEYVLGTLEPDERVRAHAMLDVDHGFRAMVRIWERRFGELHLMVEPVDPPPEIWDRIKAQLPPVAGAASETASTQMPGAEPGGTVVAALQTPESAPEAEPAPAELPSAPGTQIAGEETAAPAAPGTADDQPPGGQPPGDQPLGGLRPAEPVVAVATVPLPPPAASDPGRALRTWRALALAMTVVAVALIALGGAWKFFPDRMPVVVQKLFQPSAGPLPDSSRPAPPAQFEE